LQVQMRWYRGGAEVVQQSRCRRDAEAVQGRSPQPQEVVIVQVLRL
jgi:hypothetical protein